MRSRGSCFVGVVVSRLYMSSGGLAVGLAGKDCSSTSCAVAKGMCPFPLWLQAALWAEVFPADTQRIEGLNGQVVSAARFAPNVQLPLMSARRLNNEGIVCSIHVLSRTPGLMRFTLALACLHCYLDHMTFPLAGTGHHSRRV